jgi:hypothetical protein
MLVIVLLLMSSRVLPSALGVTGIVSDIVRLTNMDGNDQIVIFGDYEVDRVPSLALLTM